LDACERLLKVAIGVTVWAKAASSSRLDGIGHYSQELFSALAPEVEQRVPVAFGRLSRDTIQGIPIRRFSRYDVMSLLAGTTGYAFKSVQSNLGDVDLFHATDHLTPKLAGVPVVATLMDAIPLSHPQWVNQHLRALKNWLWRASGQWADHVVTISEFSKREIAHHFGIPEAKISVTPLGVDARYFERLAGIEADAVVTKFRLPEQYFLFVGTLQPRKNVERILDAHAALPIALQRSVPLLVVGRHGWGCDALVARLKAHGEDGTVRWLQNVTDFEKRVMLQRATTLVFPSLLEGFGLPVLEAFASQTPVITSNTTSLPEVAADAAWLVDPLSVSELTQAMADLATQSSLCEQFVSRGLVRARQFTWESCADATVKIYRSVIAGRL
jgi:glycosyltransferase involved in cell wall biosynthesis